MIQIAELGGVYAVSFLVIAVNVALAASVVLPRRRAIVVLGLAGVLVGGTLLFGERRLREAPRPRRRRPSPSCSRRSRNR